MDIAGEKWTDVLPAIISTVGFGLVIYQIWRLKLSVQGETHSRLYNHYLEINKLLLAKPNLRPYFYENKVFGRGESGTEEAQLRGEVEMMCELIAGLLEHAVLQKNKLPPDSWENCWKAYTYERFEKSGELERFFAENQKWYAKVFCDLVNERSKTNR